LVTLLLCKVTDGTIGATCEEEITGARLVLVVDEERAWIGVGDGLRIADGLVLLEVGDELRIPAGLDCIGVCSKGAEEEITVLGVGIEEEAE
jgi:hypothetical protein